MTQKPIAPCLWFDGQAEEAANFYCSVFKDSRIVHVDRFTDNVPDPDGSVLFIEFEINGQPFQALNGGPEFKFSEAVSFSVDCKDQEELDYYWDALLKGGGEPSQCGWLKDKFGVSWQIVPRVLNEMVRDPDRERASAAFRQMMSMVKLDIAPLEAAYDGKR